MCSSHKGTRQQQPDQWFLSLSCFTLSLSLSLCASAHAASGAGTYADASATAAVKMLLPSPLLPMNRAARQERERDGHSCNVQSERERERDRDRDNCKSIEAYNCCRLQPLPQNQSRGAAASRSLFPFKQREKVQQKENKRITAARCVQESEAE